MRRISGIVLFMLFLGVANGQQIRVGVHAGIDAARFRISGVEGGPLKYKSELTGGVSVEAAFSPVVGVQLEGNFSQQGTGLISDDASNALTYSLDYITVPLMIKLAATPQLSFHAGPQVGFLLSAHQRSISTPGQDDIKDQLEKTSYYAILGSEYRFSNGVTLGARYNTGFGSINKTGAEIRNTYFTFRVGYSFSCKK